MSFGLALQMPAHQASSHKPRATLTLSSWPLLLHPLNTPNRVLRSLPGHWVRASCFRAEFLKEPLR